MMIKDCPLPRLQITSGSLAADWVARHAAYFGRPLSAIQERGRPVHIFVDDEILVRQDDTATLQHFVSHYNATVEKPLPVPPQPKGMDPARRRSTEGMPLFARVRFRGEHIPVDSLDAASREQSEGPLQVTSRAGAGTLALANLLQREGRRVSLNSIGQSSALPASSSAEDTMWGDSRDAYQWGEFSGPSRIARAWQLIGAYSQVRSLSSPVFLGIFDAGFALDAQGKFATADVPVMIGYNLNQEGQSAGGPNNEGDKPWHGTGTVSCAAALVGNNIGAAGSGGVTTAGNFPIVVPVLFKTFRSVDEVVRGLQLSVAWGVDVVNFSFIIQYFRPTVEPGNWDDAFQFAMDQGIIAVASAGNEGFNLPDDAVVVPATRTPGTITVGALNPDNFTPRSDSSYGSSVDIWAPGTNIHVIPDFPGGWFSGTSAASPLVAGIVSLMKAIQPAMHTGDVKKILRDTGYHPGDPKVTAALDAYAALLRTMGDQLPPGTIEEPNNDAQSAREIFPDPSGVLAPVGITTISQRSDTDWWLFKVLQYSTCVVSVKFVPELSSIRVELVPDDPDNPAPGKFAVTQNQNELQISTAIIPPGTYRVKVGGTAPNMYELRVKLTPHPLTPDIFEANNSFEQAAHFTMDASHISPVVSLHGPRRPGTFDANLHTPADVDFFHITEIPEIALVDCIFSILESDVPLDVTIFGHDKSVIKQANGIRTGDFPLPAPECWARVSGATENQYAFRIKSRRNDRMIPPLVDNNPLDVPHWWPDPPFRLGDWEQYLRVEITNELKQVGRLRLTGSPGLTLHVLQPVTGEVVASGTKVNTDAVGAVEVDVSDLAEGTHLLRVGRDLNPSQRLDRHLGKTVATFNVGPAW